jgi:hypothetical protein
MATSMRSYDIRATGFHSHIVVVLVYSPALFVIAAKEANGLLERQITVMLGVMPSIVNPFSRSELLLLCCFYDFSAFLPVDLRI